MGEPTVEDGSSKKVKLEQSESEGPEAKKVKVENETENANGVEVKTEEGVEAKKENGAKVDIQTAEEKGEPGLDFTIANQIEYYFGDINLPKDKFLQEQIKLEEGWVPLDVMLRFQRLSQLSKKAETIAAALRKCSTLMEVNEDGTKIRRSPNKPLPEMNEEWQKRLNERTVYCKGFPQSLTSIGDYLDFFKPFGPVEHINLRKYLDRSTKKMMFKGTAYILFETKEAADNFLALDGVKFQGTELITMTHAAHSEEKKKEKDERWGKKVKKDNNATEDKDKNKGKGKELNKGCIVKISDIKDEELSRDVIKSTLTGLGAAVAFVQYNTGDKEALVRLMSKEDGAATEFLKKLTESGEKVKFGEEEMAVSVVEGEEEEAFLQRSRESFDKSSKFHNKKGHKHHKGGHNKFRGHKRGRSPARDGPPAKKEATS